MVTETIYLNSFAVTSHNWYIVDISGKLVYLFPVVVVTKCYNLETTLIYYLFLPTLSIQRNPGHFTPYKTEKPMQVRSLSRILLN